MQSEDQFGLFDIESQQQINLQQAQPDYFFGAEDRTTGLLHNGVEIPVDTDLQFSGNKQSQKIPAQNQDQEQSCPFDMPPGFREQEPQNQFNPIYWMHNPIIQGLRPIQIAEISEEPQNNRPARIPARGIPTIEVTVPFRRVINERSGTYQRQNDSPFNNRPRNVRIILRQFTQQFQIKKEFQREWLKILGNPANNSLKKLQIQLGKLGKFYYQNQKACCENKCQNFFDHLDYMIQSNHMLRAMKLQFGNNLEGQWDCGYAFMFCHNGRQNEERINEGKDRTSINSWRKQQIKDFIRSFLSIN